MARIAAPFADFAPSDNEAQTERELVRPVLAVGFPLFRADTNGPIHEVFFTDSAGYARSPEAPPRTPPHLREVQLPSHHSASRGRRSEA